MEFNGNKMKKCNEEAHRINFNMRMDYIYINIYIKSNIILLNTSSLVILCSSMSTLELFHYYMRLTKKIYLNHSEQFDFCLLSQNF